MHKSFTLIELMVTVGIIILLAAVSGPALSSERKRASLDAALRQFRDAISQTQVYAQSPEKIMVDDEPILPIAYIFVINTDTANRPFKGTNLDPKEYGIFGVVAWTGSPANFPLVKKGQIKSVTMDFTGCPKGYCNGTDKLMKIVFRVPDGLAGCADGIYYYKTDANKNPYGTVNASFSSATTGCAGPRTYATYPADWKDDTLYLQIKMNMGNSYRKIRINKISGEVQACICADPPTCTSNTCTPI